jgi:excisionase family DNA binding protein
MLYFSLQDKGDNMQNDLLTVFTVAQILNRSPSTIRKYEGEGKLKAVRTSAGARLFRRATVERFIQKHREQGAGDQRPAA